MDKTAFSILGGGEREITLVKLLPPGADDTDQLAKDIEYCPAPEDVRGEHDIRLARPRDAESISRLALRAHGALLFSEHIYYPARVREMLESGEMHSIVVESPNGAIMGHGALVAAFPGARVEEMTFLVVDRRSQGRSYSRAIGEALVANAAARGIWGLFALAVTNHVSSQRPLEHLGFGAWALLLAASPASRVWRQDAQGKPGRSEEPGRIANLAFIRRLGAATGAPLFAPAAHRRMIEHIFENAGVSMIFHDAGECRLPEADARITTLSGGKEGWGTIFVLEYGRDIISQTAEQLRLLRAQSVAAIYLLLPLDVPITAFISERFEEMGFFFAGVLPYPGGRYHLALQFLNNCDPGYDAIRINTPFGRRLMEYVRSCDPKYSG